MSGAGQAARRRKGDVRVQGEKRLQEIAERALHRASADQTEVIVTAGQAHLTRFAVNTIHQNVTERDVNVRLRVIVGKKTGVASGNDVSDGGLARLVGMAESARGTVAGRHTWRRSEHSTDHRRGP